MPVEKVKSRDYIARKLSEFRSLPDDWDGDGSIAPHPQAVSGAESFLRRLPEAMLGCFLMPCHDGTVVAEWITDVGILELFFSGHKTVVYYKQARPFEDRKAHTGVIALVETEKLLSLVRWVHGNGQ